MRYCLVITVVAFSLIGTFHASASAQDQSEEPRKIQVRVVPVYPELARRMQLRGTVKVEVVVSPDGKVNSTKVVGGSPVLANAAVEAIGKWRWAAAPHETKELIQLNFHPD